MERAQGIRPSQFVTTYGPGALLEGLNGPRIILSIEHSGLFAQATPEQFQIVDPALTQILPERGLIFRLPTNADFNRPESKHIYETRPFPSWSLCLQHNLLYRRRDFDSRKTGCPECKPERNKYEASARARREAVNFVQACSEGHLGDVAWVGLVHRGGECKPDYLIWDARGSALRSVTIRCPKCPGAFNLGEEYSRDHTCFGSYPERRQSGSPCQAGARITQRGAAHLFVPEVLSSITVPRVATKLHQALSTPQVVTYIDTHLELMDCLPSAEKLRERLEKMQLSPEALQTIAAASGQAIEQALRDIHEQELPDGPEAARLLEFRELQRAADQGQKTESSTAAWTPSDFEVDPDLARVLPLGNYSLRVTPVSRLRAVMVQTGYRRLSGNHVVSCAYQRGPVTWFPGVEMFGEGLFLDLAPASLGPAGHPGAGPAWRAWEARFREHGETHQHPAFVWWHTLAHRLVRALAIDSGYSSASVRERVYLRVNEDGAVGGILLYAVQPGGDGTLGGLIALVPRFERVLEGVLRYLDGCSNDPLCREARPEAARANGAACFACCLVSETSCEHRNTSLDRLLLVETVGQG